MLHRLAPRERPCPGTQAVGPLLDQELVERLALKGEMQNEQQFVAINQPVRKPGYYLDPIADSG